MSAIAHRVVHVRRRMPPTFITLAVVSCSLWLGWVGTSKLPAEDDTAENPPLGDLSGTYVCEQFRLELAKTESGAYVGHRVPLEGRGAGRDLSAAAKVV